MESCCCVVEVEWLQNQSGKHMRCEMETSGPKGQWKSEVDPDKKGEIGKTHLRMEWGSV